LCSPFLCLVSIPVAWKMSSRGDNLCGGGALADDGVVIRIMIQAGA
jgi:hypothetical protein